MNHGSFKVCLFADAQSIHTRRIATGLASRGLTVHIVTHKPATIRGVTVEQYRVPPPGITNPYRWASRRNRYLRDFVRRFDIINIQFLQDWGFTTEMIEEGTFVVTPWGSDIVQAPGEDAPPAELRNHRSMLLRNAAAVTAWGSAFAHSIADYASIDENAIHRIPLGVDLELFSLSNLANGVDNPIPPLIRGDKGGSLQLAPNCQTIDDAFHVGFFKGYRAVYGPTYLIEAIPLILEKLPRTQFTLIGDGPQLAECQQMAHSSNINHAITWLTPQPHDRIPSHLAQWDLTVIPSVCESFGAAALEAAAMQVPVVASRVGGLIDTVRHNETGLLVPSKDPHALADATVTLLNDPTRRRQLGQAARRFVESNYCWNHCIDLWLQTFEQALNRCAIPA